MSDDHDNKPLNDPASASPQVRDNVPLSRYEIELDGEVAFLEYTRHADRIVLAHTEVPPAFQGRGFANVLAKYALDRAREENLRPVIRCPFVQAFVKRHPEYAT